MLVSLASHVVYSYPLISITALYGFHWTHTVSCVFFFASVSFILFELLNSCHVPSLNMNHPEA